MHTYLNKNGKPMIRSCGKCKHYNKIETNDKMGYCRLQQTMFAYTMEKTVYDIKMTFYLCEKHEFHNEEWLSKYGQSVDLLSSLKSKDELEH